MKVEMIDGVRVLKLRDHPGTHAARDDMMTVAHLWRLLSGGHALRDATPTMRHYL